ncbi:hypothetical protein ABZT51_46250, partial [Streptomyces sp. NPDC005373]|uniref:hypothetical protein n=1 Tax=Streptomyces sp. NPDC005373 TaxID=3156879 RepID=UPI0033A109C9
MCASGQQREPVAEPALAEIEGHGPDGSPLSAYTQLEDGGSTRYRCGIYLLILASAPAFTPGVKA